MRLVLVATLVLLAALALACPSDNQSPGDVVLGDFTFEADPVDGGCPFAGAGEPLRFMGTLSLDSRTGAAWLTTNSYEHQGTFSTGSMSVRAEAERIAPLPCSGMTTNAAPMRVIEEISARLYLEEEARAVGGCPWPVDATPDGGMAWDSERLRDGGLDVRLVCGTLTDRFVPTEPSVCKGSNDASVPFEGCEVLFKLSGRPD